MSKFTSVDDLYPLKFQPIFQERIWGGDMMSEILGRKLPESAVPIGESWEISDREGAVSVVANGKLAGKTLNELMKNYRQLLTGSSCRSTDRFPLLVKIIDAGERLSLQVHPDAANAAAIGGGAEAKTEMWYVIAARRGARILAGLSNRATKQLLLERMTSPDAESLFQNFESKPGDSYFISAGTPHAIGAGNLILEIQQNSDTTYRISDWGRVDSAGKSRELHTEAGIRCIDFPSRAIPRIAGVVGGANHNRKFNVVNRCAFFQVSDLRLVSPWIDNTSPGSSFHLLSAVDAPVMVGRQDDPGNMVRLEVGETVLVPACYGAYVIEPLMSGETAVVRTTL